MHKLPFNLGQELIVGLFAAFDTKPSNPPYFFPQFRRVLYSAHVYEEITEYGYLNIDVKYYLQNQVGS